MTKIKSIVIIILTTLFFVGCQEKAEDAAIENAQYKVTFHAYWSKDTHPNEFPTGPHFSGIIGLTHKNDNPIFVMGELASEGIKVMAEVGGKTLLSEEINAHISNNDAGELISGGGISKSPGTVSVTFNALSSFPYVTIVSMLAPSPDWFIAIEKVALLDRDSWVSQKIVPVVIYDAGTDAGTTFQSTDTVENPQKNIEFITSAPLAVNETVPLLGEFVFELLED